ncbi:MAG: hypothetical protein SGJ20_16980 [Planctomycetota bacterium]|nr:hypothetical protein [Planctomycetota bacterium]
MVTSLHRPDRPGSQPLIWLWILFLTFAGVGLSGCSGCWSEDPQTAAEREKQEEEEAKKKDKKGKPKPPFEPVKFTVLPQGSAVKGRPRFVKPGHWNVLSEEMQSNYENYVGELSTVYKPGQGGAPIPIARTPFAISSTRPAPLAKSTPKVFDITTYVPLGAVNLRVDSELSEQNGGGEILKVTEFATAMQSHQYYFAVLASQPQRYKRLEMLDAVRAPGLEGYLNHYQVAFSIANKRVTLPAQSLAWTSISHVLWDGVDPSMLDIEQQNAMLDWIHWGGELIISGPDTLEKLKGSFLDPSADRSYLPALPGSGTPTLSITEVAELGGLWLDPEKKTKAKNPHLVARSDWPTVELIKHPKAQFVLDTKEQVVERSVGRGRILVTSFRIGQSDLMNWSGFDSFFNAVLLRKPGREFLPTGFNSAWARYKDQALHARNYLLDPRYITSLRYFSRDAGDKGQFSPDGPLHEPLNSSIDPEQQTTPVDQSDPGFTINDATTQSGMAGWNDLKGVPNVARDALRKAAGITIPDSTFVLFVLTIYLIVLVPLNWGIFRVLGHVEWAWFASPIIAIAGGMAVVKLAELDIGFVRSQTEVTFLEMQGDYPRGHLSRYTALYSSLNTSYDLQLADANGVALPFPTDSNFTRLIGQRINDVYYDRQGDKTVLRGFTVDSNSTGMVHSEEMVDMQGPIRLVEKPGRTEVFNKTKYPLSAAGLIRKTDEGKIEVAYVGDLGPGAGSVVHWIPDPGGDSKITQWELRRPAEFEGVHMGGFYRLAQQTAGLATGEVRLIATIDQSIAPMTITPEAAQSSQSPVFLIANLRAAALPEPQLDKNCKADVPGIQDDRVDELEPEEEMEEEEKP